jgi:hypothetical protein
MMTCEPGGTTMVVGIGVPRSNLGGIHQFGSYGWLGPSQWHIVISVPPFGPCLEGPMPLLSHIW